ncbi:SMI1/KNR4 family protein [Nonomuraea cavernae]|uniref:SMI1/KNR4 family protein n=1 Tax=Nonomuraea cavernae TaxID=2045107 RepID=UPI0033C07412
MVKLVRLALTGAVLAAIAVRLSRRARLPERERPEQAPDRATRADLPRRPVGRTRRTWPALFGMGALAAAVLMFSTQVATPGEQAKRAPWSTLESAPEPTSGSAPESAADPGAPQAVLSTPAATTPAATPSTSGPDPECAPGRRPVVVRPIDPKVKRAVDRQWRRIERWLETRAPRTHATLGGPGRARTIAIAEAQMGLDLPDDLRASLLRHNGTGAFGLGATAPSSSIRDIRDLWRDLCRPGSANLGHEPREEWWNGRMIPFAYRADRGYGLIDSRVGDVGWDDLVAGRTFPAMPSYYALLRATADALERGGEVAGWTPRVTRGVLRWTPPR